MTKILLAALFTALAAPAFAHSAPAEPANLTLIFETGTATGAVMVTLFDSEAAYTGSTPIRQARIDLAKGERTVSFTDLKAGDYAVKAFHDIDGDGRMTTNPFGIPIEPFAFSNDARGNMGPASWGMARVAVNGATTQTIKFR